ncbi:uncharacterized protein SAPINGB_P002159 [Magnusiomyces paraingens]|uniref:Uncharacterized protein n=1 Tax=Magnusiomyces paraingens TaxID=2606893 RepID=A0A5E8BD30_9ASCO|nr:uncharacterized protein SAPINGB_P002159 [Saprochaete ingens]VVT49214.1 unnamed protein product [Saprochaete ingens]
MSDCGGGSNGSESKNSMALAADLSPKICDLVKSLKESIVYNTLHGSTTLVKSKELMDPTTSSSTTSSPQTKIDTGSLSLSLDDIERGVCNSVLARLVESEHIVNSSDLLTLSDRFDKKLAEAAKNRVTADDIVMVDERVTELSKVVLQTMNLSRSCESQMQVMAKRLKSLEKQGIQKEKSASDELEQEFAQREVSRRLGALESELRELAAKISAAGTVVNEGAEYEEEEKKLKKMMVQQEVGSCCLKNFNERMAELDGSLLTLRENVDKLWKHHEEDIAKLMRGYQQQQPLRNKNSLPLPNEEIYNELMKACDADNLGDDLQQKSVHGNSYQMWIVMLWRRIGELESEVRNMSLRGLGSGSSSVSMTEGGYETFHTARCLETGSFQSGCGSGGSSCSRNGSILSSSNSNSNSGGGHCLESFNTPQTEFSEKSGLSSPIGNNEKKTKVDKEFGNTLRLAPSRQAKKNIRIPGVSEGQGTRNGSFSGSLTDFEDEFLSVYEFPSPLEIGKVVGVTLQNEGYNKMSKHSTVKSPDPNKDEGNEDDDEDEDEYDDEDKEDYENQWKSYNGGKISASMQGVLRLDDKLRCLRSTIGRSGGAGVVMVGAPREVTNIGGVTGVNQFKAYTGDGDGDGDVDGGKEEEEKEEGEGEEEDNYNSTATEYGSNYTIFSAGNNGTSIGGRNFASYFATPMKRPTPVYGNEKVLGFYKYEFYKDYTSTNPYQKSVTTKMTNKYRHRLMRPFFKKSSGVNQ